MGARPLLPSDATLLALSEGALLVSREWAVFCSIPSDEPIRAVLEGNEPLEALSTETRDALHRHGFFEGPRAAAPVHHTVQLQLTNACNLACAYCCTNSAKAREAEVREERLRQLVREVRDAQGTGVRVSLLGGEPFLVPWAIDLAEHVLDLGLELGVFTNATLHARDEDLARRTAALCQRGAEVRVSLAGPTEASCDAISGAARFERVLSGIEAIARHGGKVAVDLMLLPEHVSLVGSALPALRRRLPGGTSLSFGLLYHSGRERGERVFASRADLEAALDHIAFTAGETITATRRAPVTARREGCGCALGHHLHVRSDGALFSCFKMEEQVGDLSRDPFVGVARRLAEAPHRATTALPCADCPLTTLCGGGCRSENQLYTGDPDLPACGPWRVRVVSELLAEDRISCLEWPVTHLLAEARHRGIDTPELQPLRPSRHLVDC